MVGYPIVTGENRSTHSRQSGSQRAKFLWDSSQTTLRESPSSRHRFRPHIFPSIGSAGPETVYPAPGVPFGLSFLGTAFSDFELISFGFAYEQKTQTRLMRKAYPAAIPKTQLKDVIGKGKKLRRGLLSLLLHLFD